MVIGTAVSQASALYSAVSNIYNIFSSVIRGFEQAYNKKS